MSENCWSVSATAARTATLWPHSATVMRSAYDAQLFVALKFDDDDDDGGGGLAELIVRVSDFNARGLVLVHSGIARNQRVNLTI